MKNKISVKDLSVQEIREKLIEEKKQQSKLKFNHAVSPLENPLKIRSGRRNIARLMTELSAKLSQDKKA